MKPFTKYLVLFVVAALLGAASVKGFEYFNSRNVEEKAPAEEENNTEENQEKTKVINEIKKTDTKETVKKEVLIKENTGPAINLSASPSQQLIELYYQRLANGELDEAYAMKKYMKTPISTFKGWYKNLKSTKFLDLIEVAENQYDFLVELEYEDGTKERYRVVMQVEGNLLNTISSVETNEKPELRFVYGEEGDITSLFLVVNNNKTLIDTAKKSKYEEFNNVEITYGGEYLMYWKSGLEWNAGKVYDIAAKKDVHDIDSTRGLYGFTYDMKHFYNCTESGMAGGNVEVFSVPDFKLEKNLVAKDSLVFGCDGYDKKTNTLKYTLSFNGFENKKSYVYDFSTGNLK